MDTKRTILTEKELNLIEDLIAHYGPVVDFEQFYTQVKGNLSRQEARNLVAKLMDNGWLVSIKKGTYYITSLESRGVANISFLAIAQLLYQDSYISFEAALQYHNMFDQLLRTVTSVSLRQKQTKEIQGIRYKFIKTNQDNFYGFEEVQLEGRLVKIATAEKAILDILNLRRTIHCVDLVLEKIMQHKDEFNWQRLVQYCQKQSITTTRVIGFLLDKAGIDSTEVYNLVRDKKGASYLSKDSTNFNAKWRLYYHNHFQS